MRETLAQRDQYAQLMGPAFVAGMESVEVPPGADPIMGRVVCQQAVRTCLEKIDWEASGLPYHSFGIGEEIEPREYALRLMVLAFDDASELTKRAAEFVQDALPDTTPGPLLARSKGLLALARLPDTDRSAVLHSLSPLYKEYRHKVSNWVDYVNYGDEPFVLIAGRDGEMSLDWCPEIKDWMNDRITSESGCPASRISVEIPGGKKVNLLSYFWYKLIERIYP